MNTVDKLTHYHVPPLSLQAGSGGVSSVMPTCSLSPHLHPKAEVARLPSSSQYHLKTEMLGPGVGRSLSTTYKDENFLQFSFFQELPLKGNLGRWYFAFLCAQFRQDHSHQPNGGYTTSLFL